MKRTAPRIVDEFAYRGLVEAVTDVAIYRLDGAGRVESWNPGARRLKGYDAAEIVGQHFSCFYTEEDRKTGLPDRALLIAARDGAFETDGWRVRKDGSRFWAHVVIDPIRDESGTVAGFAKVTFDGTRDRERQQQIEQINATLEQQVQARTALLRNLTVLQRAVLAHAAIGIIATDVTGTITLFNPAAERMLGYKESELSGKETPALFHDPDEMRAYAEDLSKELGTPIRSGFAAAAAKARTGIPAIREMTLVRKDGLRLPVLLNVTALRDEGGAIFGYLGMVVDLTERRERERLLTERTREAEAAVSAKSRFLANMSHEIRSPMNAILGMLQILMQSGLSAEQTDYASKAYSSTGSLLRLLNDVLDVSKMEADKLVLEQASFSLDALMCDVQSLTAPAIGDKPVTLDISIEPGLRDQVKGDMFRLRQVLLNLIGNAIKFTARGAVRVSLRRPPAERRRSVFQFAVEDTGIGIPADKLDAMFEDFQQADNSTTRCYGGTGLGLSISQKLIGLMGGRLEVVSTPGAGSRFAFTLSLPPAVGEARAAGAAYEDLTAAKIDKQLDGLKLLVVDDVPLNLEVARHLLTAAGAIVTVAESGASAIDLARAAQPPFDAILMDLQMPGMDGLEATRRLRASPEHEATPIIAVTANAMEVEKQACLEAGMNDHVAKPFNIVDLVPVILSHRSARKKPSLVNKDLALQRLAGDEALFVKIARQFVRDSAAAMDELADIIAHEAAADGAALLHKFKSQAGMVGAQRLAGMAAGLEAELKAGSLEVNIAGLRALLADTSRELAFLIDAMTPATAPPKSRTAPLADRLAELDALLEAGNMRALEVCAGLEDDRRGVADDPFLVVVKAIDRLDFPAARQAIKAMAAMVEPG